MKKSPLERHRVWNLDVEHDGGLSRPRDGVAERLEPHPSEDNQRREVEEPYTSKLVLVVEGFCLPVCFELEDEGQWA